MVKPEKKTKQTKQNKIVDLQQRVQKYKNIFLVFYNYINNQIIQQLKEEVFPQEYLYFGSNTDIRRLLGFTEEESIKQNTYKLGKAAKGKCFLIFTNKTISEINKLLTQVSGESFLQGNDIVPQTIVIPAGQLPQFPFNMAEQLRKLGMPVDLRMEKIYIDHDYTICEQGQQITSAQATLLKHFGFQLGSYSFSAGICYLNDDKDILLLQDKYAELLD